MTDAKVWLITGAARGMGESLVRAALSDGQMVVATGRRPDEITRTFGDRDDLLAVRLDVTSTADADAAAGAAVERFGRIDVVGQQCRRVVQGLFRGDVGGAGRAATGDEPVGSDERHAGRAAGDASPAFRPPDCDLVRGWFGRVRVLVGVRRLQGRAGGLDGRTRSGGCAVRHQHHDRQSGILPHGSRESRVVDLAGLAIDDYAERSAAQRQWWQAQDGRQPGDPDKLARRCWRSLRRCRHRSASSPAPM